MVLQTILMTVVGFSVPAVTTEGRAECRFALATTGNPYDGEENDVRVRFVRDGKTFERLGFFDGKEWRARLRTEKAGQAVAYSVWVNGKRSAVFGEVKSAPVTVPADGIVRVSKSDPTRFAGEDGAAVYPVGCNVAWQNGSEPTIGEQLATLAKSGVNWSRIWANHWDGKNPYWKVDAEPVKDGWMYPGVLDKWDGIYAAAEKSGVRFQMVLFHHGPWSVDVNSNWGENPWNVKNGGFLKEPREFFTNGKAVQLSKNWVRYAIARWGSSPAVFAWELFNEVEWTQPPRQDKDWGPVVAWHNMMADYIRSLDANKHMVTTSSAMDEPALWEKMDYYQPHGYPTNVGAMMRGAKVPTDKPMFFGEFGASGPSQDGALRDGLWASALAGHSGAACFWYWDKVGSSPEYQAEYKKFTDTIKSTPWLKAGKGSKVDLKISTEGKAPMKLVPAVGWGETTQFDVDLTRGDGSATMAGVSSYFNSQTAGNKNLFSKPLTVTYVAGADTKLAVRIVQIGPGGADLKVDVDGQEALSKSWGADALKGKGPETVEVALPAGRHKVAIRSTGNDWFLVQSIEITGLAADVEGWAQATEDALLMRLVRRNKGTSGTATVGGFAGVLRPGDYTATVRDLNTGETRTASVKVAANGSLGTVAMESDDEVWCLVRKPD